MSSLLNNNSTCNICCDNYNKSTRTKVCCPYCDFDVCRECCEKYILSESVAKCMKPDCHKEWSRKFLKDNFTQVFMNKKYKAHLEDLLFEQEKSLMPATQPLIEAKKVKQDILEKIKDINRLIHDLMQEKYDLNHKLHNNSYMEELNKDVSKFVRQCPADGCRGYLSSQWKCGICEKWSCPHCHELKGLVRDCGHVCKPENVESAKAIAKDSKPCPKCRSMIFKVSGCDQIWCTMCHIAFNWKNGQIENKIHNPHYYEWLNKKGKLERNEGDVECGREISVQLISRMSKLFNKHSNLYSKPGYWLENIINLREIMVTTIHNTEVELPKFRRDYFTANQNLRIDYLEGKISEETFKKLIQRHDITTKKNNEIAQVINMSITAITDVVYRIEDDLKTSPPNKHNLDELMDEFNNIKIYCNGLFQDIGDTYKCVKYAFDNMFRLVSVKIEKKNAGTATAAAVQYVYNTDSDNSDSDSDM